ncbi:MAG: hypothetical protein R3272_03600 [Candidatus Promineifilaceae bacterium]|nr:hypothetical protein [Candidatus Promineifilaceae bacterium]
MNNRQHRSFLYFVLPLLLATLACAPLESLRRFGDSDAGQQAGNLAATARSVATERGGDLAATAAAVAVDRGGQLASTVQATEFQVDVTVDATVLREKVASAQRDANGVVTITITDDELNQAVQFREVSAGEQGAIAGLRNAHITFTGGNAVLSAEVTEPVQAPLIASFNPLIVEGLPRFDLVNASVGGLSVPPAMLNSVEFLVNHNLGQALSVVPPGYGVREISISEGVMTIIAATGG